MPVTKVPVPEKKRPAKKVPAENGVKRKHKQDYVKYGFAASGSDDHQPPLCIICNFTLSNEAPIPANSADT